MAYKKSNGCPYFAPRNKGCSHRTNNQKFSIWSKKSRCPYNNPRKCRLFIEWLEIKESITRLAKNRFKEYSNEGL